MPKRPVLKYMHND